MYRLFHKEIDVKSFIQVEKANHGVKKLCEILDFPRSSFYYEQKEKSAEKLECHEDIKEKLVEIHKAGRGLYGKRRMRAALKKEGIIVGLYLVRKMMKELKLESNLKKKFKPKKSSQNESQSSVASFLFRNGFNVNKPNTAYSTDITYVKTRAGWKYLCVFLDMCTRKIVGYSLQNKMDANLVIAALNHAIIREHPPQCLIIHSDKGSQYTSKAFMDFCKSHSFIQSMSGKGACFDNAITETFNATIKKELVYQMDFENIEQASIAIFEYIETFYNRQRLHSSLGYLSPVEFETMVA